MHGIKERGRAFSFSDFEVKKKKKQQHNSSIIHIQSADEHEEVQIKHVLNCYIQGNSFLR